MRAQCRFRSAVCRSCQEIGRIDGVCRAKQKHSKPQTEADAISTMDAMKNTSFPSRLQVIPVSSERTFETLHKNNKKLKLAQSTHSLFTFPRPIASVLCKYQAVFTPDLGCYRGVPVSLNLDPLVRKVLFAVKEKIDAELDELIEQKVLEPITTIRRKFQQSLIRHNQRLQLQQSLRIWRDKLLKDGYMEMNEKAESTCCIPIKFEVQSGFAIMREVDLGVQFAPTSKCKHRFEINTSCRNILHIV
ncbi:hypothetical protein T07_240 [Trichinella nelsoni]|uniref:Uncharacterized protein n=1 Tax=Trichinella nelsoni TaxID=6336 RepID=A0A0V0S330_9BILA|nr:hypothetical protein T07_240 [Trichinella nelsoni]